MQDGVFCSFTGSSGILNSNCHVRQRKEGAMSCKIHMHDFKSHFWQDFLASCMRPVSMHLVMACVSCSWDSFSIFLLSLKQQQNRLIIMFSCIHFTIWPYPPQNNERKKVYFVLVNCMGWQVCYCDNQTFTVTQRPHYLKALTRDAKVSSLSARLCALILNEIKRLLFIIVHINKIF